MPCVMSLLIYFIVLFFLGLYLSLSISVSNSLFEFPIPQLYSIPSDSKTCLLELLYHKDCITPRQSWLFFFLHSYKQKQDKTKLENITIVFLSITHYDLFDHPSYVTQHMFDDMRSFFMYRVHI